MNKKDEKTYQVKMPSGATYTLRRPPVFQWIMGGRLPDSIFRIMLETVRANGTLPAETQRELESKLTTDDEVRGIVFRREVVRFAMVDPRIVDNPQSEKEIAAWDVSLLDFEFIYQWTMSGGDEANSLKNFRQKRS